MTLYTEEEVRRVISRIFPAADVFVWLHDVPLSSGFDEAAEPGRWIDTLEAELAYEEEPAASYGVVAQLNVIETMDTLGRQVLVPTDYVQRYGVPDSPFSDIFPFPPSDNVPMDDAINPSWAWKEMEESFPDYTLAENQDGSLVLDPELFFLYSERGSFVFTTDPGEAVDYDMESESAAGRTVWDREQARVERLRRAAAHAVKDLDRNQPMSVLINIVRSRLLEAGSLEADEADALSFAAALLASPAHRPLAEVLRSGESGIVEYKATAQADLRTQQKSSAAVEEVITTVAGFLNSDGGVLVIGLHDDGSEIGLAADLSRVKGDRDTLQRNVVTTLNRAIGIATVALHVSVSLKRSEDDLLVIRVTASPDPVYATVHGAEHFCIRSGSSTLRLTHSETDAYKDRHWGRGTSDLAVKPREPDSI